MTIKGCFVWCSFVRSEIKSSERMFLIVLNRPTSIKLYFSCLISVKTKCIDVCKNYTSISVNLTYFPNKRRHERRYCCFTITCILYKTAPFFSKKKEEAFSSFFKVSFLCFTYLMVWYNCPTLKFDLKSEIWFK